MKEAFENHPEEISCIIVEPVAGNMNCIPPAEGFLQGLRELCDQYGALLILDEVMTGFRVSLGGAQAFYDVKPDLTTLGKVIGGGMPVGAFGGRRDVMEYIAPTGPVYQAGTLSGNPIAMAAGLACLTELRKDGNEAKLAETCKRVAEGFKAAADKHGIPLVVNYAGAMFGFFFTDKESVTSFADVQQCDTERFKQFFHLMLDRGIYLAPSAFEAGFVSLAHTDDEIEKTLMAADEAFAELAK